MSTVKANTYQDASGGNTATINSMTPTADSLQGFRNRIINGDMRIDQRNAGAAVTASASFPVDRWKIINTTDGAFSAQRDTSAPAGFINSTKVTVTTADASVGATQQFRFQQYIEGTNVSDLAWGSASAKTITLSFWVRSSLTGTFGGSLVNDGENRSYPFTYSISAANTWEQKSVTVAGDTSGTWLTTTGIGIRLNFGLGVGSTFSATAGSWAAAEYTSATGATNLISTLNATWYITGVQLEVGSTATPFERRPYGTELMLCQRYYYRTTYGANSTTLAVGAVNSTTSAAQCGFTHPVTMRASPTAGYSGVTVYDGSTNTAVTSISAQSSSTTHSTINVGATGGGLTVGRAACILAGNSTQYLDFAIEL